MILRLLSSALPLVLVVLTACSNGPSGLKPRGNDEGTRWVLFIGNSHTTYHRVPELVRAIARQRGDASLDVYTVAFDNFALSDHWTLGHANTALTLYTWDYVVLQQGPSSLADNQLHLAYWAEQFAPLIRDAGAEPILYQIWPSIWRREDAANALHSYTNAAASVDGILAPAGDAFTIALEETDTPLPVYSNDGTHASALGAYVAAVTILARIDDVDPRTLPASIPGQSVDADIVRELQEIAHTALTRNSARPGS